MDQEKILKALRDHYFTDIETIEFLRDGGCTTYAVVCQNEKYLLKVVGSAFSDTIKQSIDITTYLKNQEFPVPRIINTKEGEPSINITDSGSEYIFILYEFIDGKEPNINEKAEKIGELTGKLHLIMQNYTGDLTVREKQFFIGRYLDILKLKGYAVKETEQYIKIGNQIWDTVKDLPYGYCHGDMHRGNLLLTPDDQLYILDFDTSCRAPRMFDVMVMCDTTNYFDYASKDKDYTTSIFNRFSEGYTKYIPLSKIEKESFYDFIAIRHYQLQATIVELFGLDCIDKQFIDKQLKWIVNWREKYVKELDINPKF